MLGEVYRARDADLWLVTIPELRATQFLKASSTLKNGQFSPDGKWVVGAIAIFQQLLGLNESVYFRPSQPRSPRYAGPRVLSGEIRAIRDYLRYLLPLSPRPTIQNGTTVPNAFV